MAHPARDIRERVQRQWPGAIVVGRGRASLIHQHPDDPARKRLDVAIGPLHIAGTDIEIDTAWQPTTGAWQYEMTLADYQAYARNVLNAGDTIQYVDPGSGQSVTFQPLGLNWVNRDNSRQQIAQPGAVAAAVDDDILRWVDGYGAGRHFSWQTQTTRLQKLLTIDSPANLPAPAAWLGTGELWLELEFIIKNSAGVELYLDGVKWTRANNLRVRTANRIEFRSLTTGAVLWYLDVPRAWDATGAEVIGQYEVRKQGGTHYITVRIPRAWLAAATYPVYIDPTIALQPDATAGADTELRYSHPDNNYGSSTMANVGCTAATALYRFLLKFDLSSLPDSAILDSSILTLYQTNARENPVTIEIFRSKRAWVETQATWNEYATGSSWQEPGGFGADDCDATVIGSLAFPGSETINTYRDFVLTPTTKADLDFGNGWLLKAKDEVTEFSSRTFRTSDYYNAAYHPKLVIEYTEDGGTDALTANDITAGTPTLGAPQVGQVHALTGTAITATAPVLGQPVIGQVHVLTGAGIVAGAPVLGAAAIGQLHALAAVAITASSPALGSPIIAQIHALTAVTIEAQAPALGAPAIGQVHALTATAIVTGQPVLDAPSIEYVPGTDALTALPITAGVPVVGSPTLGQVHALTAEAIAAGQPALDTPALVQIVALTAAGITAGAPQLTAPAIGQVHVLTASGIVAGTPEAGRPVIGHVHVLVAALLLAGAPVLGAPYLFLGQIVTPTERVYTIQSENRTYKVAAENRTYIIRR